jgi:stearoyl-CoA desaturase (delta-9 desaturase)
LGKAKWQLGNLLGFFIIHLGALAAFLPPFFSWKGALLAFMLTYVGGGIGVTLAYHRILTHRSLCVPRPVEYFLTLLGALTLEGGPIMWVALHRKHHAYSDREGDPHNSREGFWWAHMAWMYRANKALVKTSDFRRWAPDLVDDPFYQFLDRYQIAVQVAFGFLLLAIGGWSFVFWGIFVRLALTYHVTWLVNSASHTFGYRTYRSNDRSTNCWWVGLLAFGEGWHNNHHAFPFSARHGLQWFEFDLTWLMIRALQILGVAKQIKLPTPDMLERLRLDKKTAA